MAEERYTFAQARARLEEIVVQVRKKDTSLEKSLDLLEEGVRLANTCTELSDHTEWQAVVAEQAQPDAGGEAGFDPENGESGDTEEPGEDGEDAVEAEQGLVSDVEASDDDVDGAEQTA